MGRVRVSTTVDEDRLDHGRRLVGGSDSEVLDQALAALIETREQDALRANPYDVDPALTWTVPDGPDLPYDGEVPEAVLQLAAERRRNRA